MANYYVYTETKQAGEARSEERRADEHEYNLRAGNGSIEALTDGLQVVSAELAELLAEFPGLAAMAESRVQHRPALTAAVRRSELLKAVADALTRQLSKVRTETGEKLAADYSRDKNTVTAYENAAKSWSSLLESTAAVANSADDAALSGATAASLPPLPVGRVAEVGNLLAWVRSLKRFGIDVTGSLTPAVAQRLAAGR